MNKYLTITGNEFGLNPGDLDRELMSFEDANAEYEKKIAAVEYFAVILLEITDTCIKRLKTYHYES